MLTVKTNSGYIPAELVKLNNKTAIVKVSKHILVNVGKDEKGEAKLERKLITKHIKRNLSELHTVN